MSKEEFNEGFADRLRKARKAAEYTAFGLGQEIGVVQSTIAYWEDDMKANRLPNAYNLAKLCEVLHVSADCLLFGKDKV